MPTPSKPLPVLGRSNATEDVKIRDVLQEAQTILAGRVDVDNLAPVAPVTVPLLRADWGGAVIELRKDPTGVVHVSAGPRLNQALITASGSAEIALFPPGYVPARKILFGLHQHGSGSHVSVNCVLDTNGKLLVYTSAGLPSNTWDFSSIPTFRAES